MPRRRQKGGKGIIHIIGENHNESMRTIGNLVKILQTASASSKVAIVTEYGMCRTFNHIDERITICVEEPHCMNILSSVILLMAMLCLYDKPENKQAFDDIHPQLTRIGYIPELKDTNDRSATLSLLFSHIMTLLENCCPSQLLTTYQEMLVKWLKECTDVTSSQSVGDDLRDRWLVGKAKELQQTSDVVVIIAGLSHLQRLMFLLNGNIERVWMV